MFQAAHVPPKDKSQEAKQALACALLFSGFQFQSSCLCCCVLDVYCGTGVEHCITSSPIRSSTSVLVFGYTATEGCESPLSGTKLNSKGPHALEDVSILKRFPLK